MDFPNLLKPIKLDFYLFNFNSVEGKRLPLGFRSV